MLSDELKAGHSNIYVRGMDYIYSTCLLDRERCLASTALVGTPLSRAFIQTWLVSGFRHLRTSFAAAQNSA